MGYRSQVVLAMSEELRPFFLTFLASNPDAKKMVDRADIRASDCIEKGDLVLGWDQIKWYTSYDEVAAIQGFVDNLESEDLREYGEKEGSIDWGQETFKFIRIGEEHDDVDVVGHGFWELYPETRISGISF